MTSSIVVIVRSSGLSYDVPFKALYRDMMSSLYSSDPNLNLKSLSLYFLFIFVLSMYLFPFLFILQQVFIVNAGCRI